MRAMSSPRRRLLAMAVAAACAGCRAQPEPPASDFQRSLQEQLIRARPGETVRLPAGRFTLGRTLTLADKADVTLAGAGSGQTVLSFAGQRAGAEGLKVTAADGFTLAGVTIEDTRGDGVRVERSRRVTLRDVQVEWTRGPHRDNGAYGLYPVQCQDVLIEDSVAIGASDAGIYVGQSRDVVVRRSRAERNVAGIEIENTTGADVYENSLSGNTGGILVFDLPDLPVGRGSGTRVFRNDVRANNEPNFAPSGNTVALVPAGTGILVMAADDVEVFENQVHDHKTFGVAVVSYLLTQEKIKDARYDPYPQGVEVRDNVIVGNGGDPTGGSSLTSKAAVAGLRLKLGTPLPGVVWDGFTDPAQPGAPGLCVRGNGAAAFVNLDARHDFAGLSRSLAPHDCARPRRAAVVLAER
jgi:parallel beta-helix repeat protein